MSQSESDHDVTSLQASIFLSKIARARQTPVDQKMMLGPRLFDEVCQRIRDGIRHENGDFTDEQVERELRRRLAIQRRLDERGFYEDAGWIDEE